MSQRGTAPTTRRSSTTAIRAAANIGEDVEVLDGVFQAGCNGPYSDDVPLPKKSAPTVLDLSDLGPYANALGMTVSAAGPDRVEANWTVTDALLQPYGMLHGGAHCAVVETLASLAASLWLGADGRVVGTSNTTDFYRAAGTGDRLTSVCTPLHRGRTRQVWRVETYDDRDRLIAAGQVAIQNLRA